MIQKWNPQLTKKEVLEGFTDMIPSGIFIDETNDEKDIKDWVKLIQKNMNINVSFEEFKKAYEEELSSVKYYKDVVQYVHS